jgi:hypothetical protein
MALPVSLSSTLSLGLQNSYHGPFESSGGNYYSVVIQEAGGGNTPSALSLQKATDPETSFSQVATQAIGATVTDALASVWTYQKGGEGNNTIDVAIQKVAGGTDGHNVYHTTADISADTLATETTVDAAPAGDDGANAAGCCVAREETGTDIVVVYQGEADMVKGTIYSRIDAKRWTGSSWGSAIAIDNAGEAHWTGPVIVQGSSDRMHIFFKDDTNNDGYQRTLRSDDSLETFPSSFDAAIHTSEYLFSKGELFSTTKIRIAYMNSGPEVGIVGLTTADSPTVTVAAADISGVSPGAGDGVGYAVDTDVQYALWPWASDDDLYYNFSGSDDDTFTGNESELLNTVTVTGPISANVYDRSGIKLAYIYDESGTVTYNEVDIGDGITIPATKSYTFSGKLPTVAAGKNIAVDLTNYTFTGHLPAVGTSVDIDVDIESFFAAIPPYDVAVAAGKSVAPDLTSYTLTGYEPTIIVPIVITIPATQNYTFTGYEPTIETGVNVDVGTYEYWFREAGVGWVDNNDSSYLTRGANLTGISDTGPISIAFRLKFNDPTEDGAQRYLLTHDVAGDFEIRRQGNGKLQVAAQNAASTALLWFETVATDIDSTRGWMNILISFDTNQVSGSRAPLLYINDAAESITILSDTGSAFLTNLTSGVADWGINATELGIGRTDASYGDFTLLLGTNYDWSTEGNRRKYFNADGTEAWKGKDGSLPSGTAPIIFLTGSPEPTDFTTNKGTGGGFTLNGTGWIEGPDQVIVGTGAQVIIPATQSYTFAGHLPTIETGVTISPTLTNYTLTGYEPTIETAQEVNIVIPATQNYTFAKYTPAVAAGKSVAPNLTNYTFTKYTPTIETGVTIDVSLTNYTFTKYTPAIGTGVDVDIGLTSYTFAEHLPTIEAGKNILVDLTSYTFTKYTPAVGTGIDIDIGLTNYTFSKYTPIVETGVAIIVGLTNYTFSKYTPTISTGVNIDVNLTNYTFAKYTPAVAAGKSVAPNLTNYTFTKYTPTIEAGKNILVDLTSYTFTEYLPIVSSGETLIVIGTTENYTFTEYTPALKVTIDVGLTNYTFTEHTPTVGTGVDIDIGLTNYTFSKYTPAVAAGKNIAPATQNYTFTEYTPEVAAGKNIVIGLTNYTFAEYTPSVASGETNIDVPATAFTFTEYAPEVAAGKNVDVGLSSYTFTEYTPIIGTSADIDVALTNYTFTEYTPILAQTIIAPPLFSYALTGYSPEPGTGNIIVMPLGPSYTFISYDPVFLEGWVEIDNCVPEETWVEIDNATQFYFEI